MSAKPTAKPKGHWPKGKRRNPDRGDWGIVLLSLTTLLDHHSEPGRISVRALGGVLGVSDRAVHKWLRGINRPDEGTQERVSTWVRSQQLRLGIAPKKAQRSAAE